MPQGANSSCTCVVGLQWGDEAKGKIVDLLTDQHDMVVRFNGGANAGHTVVCNGNSYKLSLLPTGVLKPHVRSVIGNGVVVYPPRFLEEIANVPLSQQAKLLRVIETGEFERLGSSRTRRVDVRIISATNANLSEEVASGRFRQDLLFRLNTIEIRLPSLRDRREDLPLLAQHFLR